MSEAVIGPDADEVSMTEDQARELTEQLKLGLEDVWELALTAFHGRVWVPLGHASWREYCARELGSCRLRPPDEPELRAAVWRPLTDAGMSVRAVAALTGQSHPTVLRALDRGEQEHLPTRAGAVRGVDGKQQPARKPTRREVLVRQARAGALHRSGSSQKQIAQELGVSQATVSVDLAEIGKIAAALDDGHPDLDLVLEQARDRAGRTDAATLAERLGVVVAPSRHLSRLVKQPARDLEATLRVVVNEVVMADEWLDPLERCAALEVLMPTTAQVLDQVRVIVAALPASDRHGEQWQAIDAAIAGLERLRKHQS